MPDYDKASGKIDSVIDKRPAENAGMKDGDVSKNSRCNN